MGNCMTNQTEDQIPEAMAEYKQPVTVATATYSIERDLLILLPGDPDYKEYATVAYDSKRGYIKMPDGSKHRILGNLATMSRRDFSKWCYENNICISDKQRIYRALRFYDFARKKRAKGNVAICNACKIVYKDPDYGRKERQANRDCHQRMRHRQRLYYRGQQQPDILLNIIA